MQEQEREEKGRRREDKERGRTHKKH